MTTYTYAFDVSGMSCGGCTSSVQRALEQLPGVTQASVTLRPGIATVTVDPARVSAAEIEAEISARGYPTKLRLAP